MGRVSVQDTPYMEKMLREPEHPWGRAKARALNARASQQPRRHETGLQGAQDPPLANYQGGKDARDGSGIGAKQPVYGEDALMRREQHHP